jgi:ABC-type nitrate/sulfonate/bicarbonate transport system permease component
MSELTTASAWIAGLAIVAMIAAGWRKPARAAAVLTREGRRSRTRAVPLTEVQTNLYRRTPVWRKLWAAMMASTLAIVIGAVLATLIAFALGWSVITLTDLLRR